MKCGGTSRYATTGNSVLSRGRRSHSAWLSSWTIASTPVAQRIYEDGKGRGRMAAAWVIEMVSRKRRAPVFERALETPIGEIRPRHVLRHKGQSESAQGRVDDQRPAAEHELAFDAHLQF